MTKTAILKSDILDFGAIAIMNAQRMALHAGEFFPIPEALMIVMSPTDMLIGARVYFEPPCKAVWVTPDGVCNYGAYDQERKTQSPLIATYHVFTALDELKVSVVYENPTAK